MCNEGEEARGNPESAVDYIGYRRRAGLFLAGMDRLRTYVNRTVPPVAEGSAQIAVDWRSVWIGLGALAGLVLVLIFVSKSLF